MDQGLNECSTILPFDYFRNYFEENPLKKKSKLAKLPNILFLSARH